jgi:hypothetical protein
MPKEFTHPPEAVQGSTRKGGDHLTPDEGTETAVKGFKTARPGVEVVREMPPGFGAADRGPSGSHLENEQPSDTVPPIATRPTQRDPHIADPT